MAEREKLQIEVYGQRYTLRVEPQEAAQAAAIAAYVDDMMHQIGDSQERLDYRDVAVLAALSITEEYFQLEKAYQDLLDILEEER